MTNLDDVVSEILRSGVRWGDLPPLVAALFGARHLLAGRSEQEQGLIHGIAMARFTGIIPRRDTAGPQRIRWARLWRDPLHLTLTGHRTLVQRLASVPLASGRVLLAGVSVDAVRLWDPWNSDLVGREIVRQVVVRESLKMCAETRNLDRTRRRRRPHPPPPRPHRDYVRRPDRMLLAHMLSGRSAYTGHNGPAREPHRPGVVVCPV
ncbi:hypothetical protein OIE68_21015 [Nocardia vinacea]|uniref:hypothetical protein n=1 Tax=Nocardia vinacea TaxID=96468 RepID=UPI002E1445AE|nr:hypothetical protein OIE68_21015 [Nocardia vinacea]